MTGVTRLRAADGIADFTDGQAGGQGHRNLAVGGRRQGRLRFKGNGVIGHAQGIEPGEFRRHTAIEVRPVSGRRRRPAPFGQGHHPGEDHGLEPAVGPHVLGPGIGLQANSRKGSHLCNLASEVWCGLQHIALIEIAKQRQHARGSFFALPIAKYSRTKARALHQLQLINKHIACLAAAAASLFLSTASGQTVTQGEERINLPAQTRLESGAYRYEPIVTQRADSAAGVFNSGMIFLADQINRNVSGDSRAPLMLFSTIDTVDCETPAAFATS